MNYDVFISHASEDKEQVALPLAKVLIRLGLRVWLDSFELRLGDSLRRSIDQGLSQSRFGIVILSPEFFRKKWPQRELDGLLARETTGKVILPVWHNLTHDDITKYSPLLADKLGVSTKRGIEYVAQQILEAIEEIPTAPKSLSEPQPTKETAPRRLFDTRLFSFRTIATAVIGIIVLVALIVNWGQIFRTDPVPCKLPKGQAWARIGKHEIIPAVTQSQQYPGSFAYLYKGDGVKLAGPDSNQNGYRSNLVLFEDCISLEKYGHSDHSKIWGEGRGLYSHWFDGSSNVLYFSTSDNSDPLENGRDYIVTVPRK